MSSRTPRSRRVPWAIGGGAGLLVLAMFALYLHAASRTNHIALSATAKPVSIQPVAKATYRPVRTYVGTLQPWSAAKVGPQYVSAYVGTVLVRPGAVVKRGEVLATLDCRNASAASREIAARARAIEERRNAAAHETERMKQMIDGGFASENEIEQLQARTSAQTAEMESMRASLASRALEVDDCVLRAPFNGEVADRFVDPGAYVRPGNPVVTVVDRDTVRVSADAPESDFAVVAPGAQVQIAAAWSDAVLRAPISRRAPAADDVTRTVHFEIDVPNRERALPVGTTATLTIEVGQPQVAAVVPLRAATLRGDKATLFTVADGVARQVVVAALGEANGLVYLQPTLAPGTPIVIEGRALLDDGDRVAARELAP